MTLLSFISLINSLSFKLIKRKKNLIFFFTSFVPSLIFFPFYIGLSFQLILFSFSLKNFFSHFLQGGLLPLKLLSLCEKVFIPPLL